MYDSYRSNESTVDIVTHVNTLFSHRVRPTEYLIRLQCPSRRLMWLLTVITVHGKYLAERNNQMLIVITILDTEQCFFKIVFCLASLLSYGLFFSY